MKKVEKTRPKAKREEDAHTRKGEPILIHDEFELLAWLDHQIYAASPNPRPIKFSKEMIERSTWKPIRKKKRVVEVI